MSLFKNQTKLDITLDCGMDLSAATNTLILYNRPDGTGGIWVATAVGNTLTYSVQDGDINQSGNWQLQPYFELAGKKAYGEIITKTFIEPIYELLIP